MELNKLLHLFRMRRSHSHANCKLYGWECTGRACTAEIDRCNTESLSSNAANISQVNSAEEAKAASTASLPLLQ
jgi:hypothetical protein